MNHLVHLWILDCLVLEDLPYFSCQTCLEGIQIIKCIKLLKITILSGVRNLERIEINGYEKLNHPRVTNSDCAITEVVSSSFDTGHL